MTSIHRVRSENPDHPASDCSPQCRFELHLKAIALQDLHAGGATGKSDLRRPAQGLRCTDSQFESFIGSNKVETCTHAVAFREIQDSFGDLGLFEVERMRCPQVRRCAHEKAKQPKCLTVTAPIGEEAKAKKVEIHAA